MAGPATFAGDESVSARARRMLDDAAATVAGMEAAQRDVVAKLVGLWPDAGWRAAGARTSKDWLRAYTGQSAGEARRLAGIAELCTRNARLGSAVVEGVFPMGWAERLARHVTDDRAPYLTDQVVDGFLGMATAGCSDDQFGEAVGWWVDRVDQEIKPCRVQRQSLVATQSLFGGGEIHAALSPGAFETVLTGIDAFTQNPDAADAPYRRTFSERRADALDDLAHFGLTHGSADGCLRNNAEPTGEDEVAPDGFDERDMLDDALDTEDGSIDLRPPHQGGDPGAYMAALRAKLRRRAQCQQRRSERQLKPRSGARLDVKIDIETLLGTRDFDDFDGLVRRSPDGWNLARNAIDQLTCDSALVATLFRGQRILDANADAEQFTLRQRRALAARDTHCVFPGCRRPPRHCDAHHLVERENGGPTVVENGCLLCRHHHRLIHLYGWTLSRDENWRWTATDAHGQTWTERRPSDSATP